MCEFDGSCSFGKIVAVAAKVAKRRCDRIWSL